MSTTNSKKVTKQGKKPMAKTTKRPTAKAARTGWLRTSRLYGLAVFAVIFAVAGAVLLHGSNANPPFSENIDKTFVNVPQKGLYWAGLKSDKKFCQEGYALVDNRGTEESCTHGPDPAPAGVDATKSVEPLATGESNLTASASGISCIDDGVSGNRVQMIYAHASDKPDRYATYASSFQAYASNMNDIFVQSGLETGSARSVRFVTDANCQVVVPDITLSTTGDDSFGNTKSELKAMGYNLSTRKYIVWVDATVYCGISNVTGDSKPTQDNLNNQGPTFGRIDSGCWGGSVEAHELTHTLGGVQLDAPHSNGAWHCFDEYDRMCYDDGSGVAMKYICASSEENRLDCNKDDYFNTSSSIPSTNYLATHWNVANSSFLAVGTSSSSTTPPPPSPTPTDTIAPTVTINSPANGSTIGKTVTITASATDNVGVAKMEVYVDNALKTSVAASSVNTKWNSMKASRGQHTIEVKAYDAAGNVSTTSVIVYK